MNFIKPILFAIGAIVIVSIQSCSLHKRTSENKPSKSATYKTSKPTSTKDVRAKYAEMMGVSTSQLNNKELYTFIDDWYGVSYRFGGNDQNGVDCSGFVGALYREVYNKQIPRTTRDIGNQAKKVADDKMQEGDIVFFDINGKKGSHIGVYLINGKFVHASTSKGVIISDLSNPYYKKAFSHGGKI